MYEVIEDLDDENIITVTFDYENISFTSEYKKELYKAILIDNMMRRIKQEYTSLKNFNFEILNKGTIYSANDGRKYIFRLKKVCVS